MIIVVCSSMDEITMNVLVDFGINTQVKLPFLTFIPLH